MDIRCGSGRFPSKHADLITFHATTSPQSFERLCHLLRQLGHVHFLCGPLFVKYGVNNAKKLELVIRHSGLFCVLDKLVRLPPAF